MKLYLSPRSPFARRVRLALDRLGLPVELVMVDALHAPSPEFLEANPLGLMPALEISPRRTMMDSGLILDFLHAEHGHKIWPSSSTQHWEQKTQSELASGVMAAAVSYFFETTRKQPESFWVDDYLETSDRVLARLASTPPAAGTQPAWDVGGMLEYLELRMPALDWRKKHPRLAPVLEACRESSELFRETRPMP